MTANNAQIQSVANELDLGNFCKEYQKIRPVLLVLENAPAPFGKVVSAVVTLFDLFCPVG